MSDQGKYEEHRLALVMNGGVSLAVWMGGLSRELDNARRASRGVVADDIGDDSALVAEAKLSNLWAKHCDGTRLVIDVIAGTSAGGLNGVLLAMASANDTPLDGLRELWMKSANLSTDALLQPQNGPPASVLNGSFFLEQISSALTNLVDMAGPEPSDVALTVTATSLQGPPRLLGDDFGSKFTQPDHRRRFEFRRAQHEVDYAPSQPPDARFPADPRDDFVDPTALALAGRASASFPVAFGPVLETLELRSQKTWPTWNPTAPLEWLADGGILDNSPFDPVLTAISRQPVSSTWRRTLCYVVPSASEQDPAIGPQQSTAAEPPPASLQPPWSSVAVASFKLPGEADFRDDMEQLADLERVGRSSYDVQRFLSLLASASLLAKAVDLATTGLPLYRQSQAVSGVYRVRNATAQPDIYVASFARAIGDFSPRPWNWLADAFPVSDLPGRWTWGTTAAQHVVATLLRSLARADAAAPDELRASLSRSDRKIASVDRAVLAELSSRTLRADAGPDQVADLASAIYDELEVPETLGLLVIAAAREYAESQMGGAEATLRVLQAALAIEVVNGVGGMPIEPKASPIFDFIRMGLSTTPATYARVVSDAMNVPATGDAANILYGTRLRHFAAFGKVEWRAWDWLWGRIHGALHLSRLLGLSEQESGELVDLIVIAEGMTPASVEAGIHKVFAETEDSLLEQMKRADEIPTAVDSVFSLLNGSLATQPPVPSPIRTGSWWAAVAVARTLPDGRSLTRFGKLVRFVARRRRNKLWDTLRGA